MLTSEDNPNDILPEEEPIFREFEAYVRSIYTQTTRGAIEQLEHAIGAYRQSVTDLTAKTAGSVIKLDDRVAHLMKTVEVSTAQLSEALRQVLTASAQSINEPLGKSLEHLNDALVLSANNNEQKLNVTTTAIAQTLKGTAREFHERLVVSLAHIDQSRDNLNLAMSVFHEDMQRFERRLTNGLEAQDKRDAIAFESLETVYQGLGEASDLIREDVSAIGETLPQIEMRLMERQKRQFLILLGVLIGFNVVSWGLFAALYLHK